MQSTVKLPWTARRSNPGGGGGILPYYRKLTMHVDNAKKFTLHKINANFPKVRFTYIKLTRNFRKQYAPNFILRKSILKEELSCR